MNQEWWLTAAISNDSLVAQLLIRLKETTTTTTNHPLPPSWGVRQPRSSIDKKRDNTPRLSPTTPLSFPLSDVSPSDSCGASHRFKSKISASTETPTITGKRPRKKKTFVELKEEESSLLKERTCLEQELVILRSTLEERRSVNDKLKRMKLDLQIEASPIKSEQRNRNQTEVPEVASSSMSRNVKSENGSNSDSSLKQRGMTVQDEEPLFMLPDLNMMPDDEAIVAMR